MQPQRRRTIPPIRPLDLFSASPPTMPSCERIPARTRQVVTTLLARVLLFLLADGGPPSSFAGELIDGEYDVTVFGRRPEADVTCPVCVEGGPPRTARECPRQKRLLRLLELAPVRAPAARVSGLRNGTAGQGGRRLQLP